MRFRHIFEAVNHRPWFITAAGFSSVQSLLATAEAKDFKLKADGGDDELSMFVRVRPPMSIDGNGIATISVFGVLGLHLTGIEKTCGNTDYKDVQREVGEAKGLGARGILYNFDTPGGMVTGCDECAQTIAMSGLPSVAFTDTQSCSGGYYLMAGTDAIVSSTSAEIGNIGVIFPWTDKDGMWEQLGLKFNPIFNTGADLKSIARGPSLTEAQRVFAQEMANDKAALFQKHVSDYRPVDDEVWRAGWYSGQRAVDLGLSDYIGDASTAYGVLLSKIPV